MLENINFSHLFHQSSKKMRGNIPLDETKWPAAWKRIEYKTYERLPKIPLDVKEYAADFFELLGKRESKQDFSCRSVSREHISALLRYSCGLKKGDAWRRAYPSAGGRFPLEFYAVVFVPGEGIPSGLYHYDIRNHQLDVLLQKDFTEEKVLDLFTYPWTVHASVAIVITACFERTQRKYAERGYRYILLEAGHASQNLSLAAPALGVRCCAIAGTKDENIEKLLDIDGVTESLVHTLLLD